jgi:protein-disulfide isomerase
MEATGRRDLKDPVNHADHAIGPMDAAVTIVEYVDFECPDCKRAAGGVKLLLRHFDGLVRLVYRHFPVDGVHPHAVLAAEAAEAAASQHRFWEMSELLFDNQPRLDLDLLYSLGDRLDLDKARFRHEMSAHLHVQKIRSQIEGGRRSGVRGTPGFFVNDTIQDVSFGMRSLFDAVEARLAHSEHGRARQRTPPELL